MFGSLTGSGDESTTITFLNGHNIKYLSKFVFLYLLISAAQTLSE